MDKNNDQIDIDTDADIEHNIESEFTFEDVDSDGKNLDSIKKVRKKLKACEAEKKEYLTGWQRAKADSVNTKKRDGALLIEAITSAQEDAFCKIIPVLDSFSMAFANKGALKDIDPNWIQGMEQINNQLAGILNENGITEIDPHGEEFDPHAHESVELKEVNEKENDHIILHVVQKGYKTDEKILRPAKVIVGTFKE